MGTLRFAHPTALNTDGTETVVVLTGVGSINNFDFSHIIASSMVQ